MKQCRRARREGALGSSKLGHDSNASKVVGDKSTSGVVSIFAILNGLLYPVV